MVPQWFATLGSPMTVESHPQLLNSQQTAQSVQGWLEQLRTTVQSSCQQGQGAAVLAAGQAYLLQFVQASVIGPIGGKDLPQAWPHQAAAEGTNGTTTAEDSWLAGALQVDGEDLLGCCPRLDLLLAALVCLAEPLGHVTTTSPPLTTSASNSSGGSAAAASGSSASGSSTSAAAPSVRPEQQGLGSWHWWCLRALLLQQQVLSGQSATLRRALQQQLGATRQHLAQLQQQAAAPGSSQPCLTAQQVQLLVVLFELEAAAVHRQYGYVREAAAALQAAAAAAGVQVSTTGALGLRTKHQVDAKAQLVAVVSSTSPHNDQQQQQQAPSSTTGAPAAAPDVLACAAGLDQDLAQLHIADVALTQELQGMEDDSAVLPTPKLLDPAAPGSSGPTPGTNHPQQQQGSRQLCGLEQALLLGWAGQVRKGTAQDELQAWEMAPYVEAVLQQQRTQYALQAAARLLKSRHEAQRPRTRERALMQIEQLASALSSTQPPAPLRSPYLFAVGFPLWARLRKELAETYIAMGFVGAALQIYEALEMWDQLIVCYRLLDKKAAAQEVISQRLKVEPRNPKLWCALGDVQKKEEHYRTAWEVSGHRSARAQRSLARAAYNRQDFAAAAAAWGEALALSPLYPDAWFSLGYCYLKLGQQRKALQAFTQVTYLEPEQGEAWTNIAALWMQLGAWRRATSASEQAVRLKRDSWQAWDNYAAAAAKAGQWLAAIRAVQQVLSLTHGQTFREDVVEVLLNTLEHWGQHQGDSEGVEQQQGGEQQQQEEEELDPQLSAALAQLADMSMQPSDPSAAEDAQNSESGPQDVTPQQPAAAGDAAGASAATEGQSREYQRLLEGVGRVVKAAVTGPSCGAAAWGALGRWYLLQGEVRSAQEAALKEVRALQGSGYTTDQQQFERMAAASLALGSASRQLSSSSPGPAGLRDLGAARLHFTSVLKQCGERFGDTPTYAKLQQEQEELQQAAAKLQGKQ